MDKFLVRTPSPTRRSSTPVPAASAVGDKTKRDATGSRSSGSSSSAGAAGQGGKKQQSLNPVEHVRRRRAIYFGCSCQPETADFYAVVVSEDGLLMELRNGTICRGVQKLFDELLVNAGDYSGTNSKIFVTFDDQTGRFAIHNEQGIWVHMMDDNQTWSVEAAFSKLNTGTNFDDDEARTTGGLNGVGAKLCNIFSAAFRVTTKCPRTGVVFRQLWQNNMEDVGQPQVYRKTKTKVPKEHRAAFCCFDDLPARFKGTEIVFSPDYASFGEGSAAVVFEQLRESLTAFIRRRCLEIAATRGVRFFFNGEAMVCKNMRDMAKLYAGPSSKPVVISGTTGSSEERWFAAVVPKIEGLKQSMSFVNGIHTSDGGTHVNEYSKIFGKVAEAMTTKTDKISGAFVRSNCDLFLSCVVVNPEFATQSKQKLTTKRAKWGSTPLFESKATGKVVSALREQIAAAHLAKQQEALGKQTRSRSSRLRTPNFDDANMAGTRKSNMATLCLTEGLSAKALVTAGLKALRKNGTDYYGVFALKGKLLNVREASASKIQQNKEIMNFLMAMGIRLNAQLRSEQGVKSLRYGSIMILTDADPDGSHIKGLVMNALARFYPKGLKTPGFVKIFHTPIVRATKRAESVDFYSLAEFEAWQQAEDRGSWRVKYYKGLGSWSNSDARKMFGNMSEHVTVMDPFTDEDVAAMEAAFGNDVGKRRALIAALPDRQPTNPKSVTSVANFVADELTECFVYTTERSIPGLDGLKPSQRKILMAALKRLSKTSDRLKVVQLAAAASEIMGYHHGEKSAEGAVVGMCQDFTGSNNLPLLYGDGQFGTVDQGGKDHAASRYIYVGMQAYTALLFPSSTQLDYNFDDGNKIEPKEFFPVVPLVLVNGASGIGTGYSCSIPPHTLGSVVHVLKAFLTDASVPEFPLPSYRGFDGPAEIAGEGRYRFSGATRSRSSSSAGSASSSSASAGSASSSSSSSSSADDVLMVDSLAPGVWTNTFVASCRKRGYDATKHATDSGSSFLKVSKDPEEVSSSKRRRTTLRQTVQDLNRSHVTVGNMWVFVRDGAGVSRLQKFTSTQAVFDAYCHMGERYYTRSLAAARVAAQVKLTELQRKRDYIQLFVDQIVAYPIVPADLHGLMSERGWADEAETQKLLRSVTDLQKTEEKIQQLSSEISGAQVNVQAWAQTTWKGMWNADLERFMGKVPPGYKH